MQAEEKHDINVKMQDELRAQRAQAEYKARTDYKTVGCEAPEKDPEPEEQEAIQQQIPDDGLSGPLLSPGTFDRGGVDLRIFAIEKAIDASRGHYTGANQIVSDARIYEAFLKGD